MQRHYSIVFEKNGRVIPYLEKAKTIKKLENTKIVLYFVFSSSGFYKNIIAFFIQNSIAWSDDQRFLNV